MKPRLPHSTYSQPDRKAIPPLSAVKIWADQLLHRLPLKYSDFHFNSFLNRRGIDPASLQFRLTLGVTACSILGLGSVAAWTSWKTQQILVNTHTENIRYISQRFPKDVAQYSEMYPAQTSVQKAIDTLSPPNLLFWVTDTNGNTFAQSKALQSASDTFMQHLQSMREASFDPQVHQVGRQYFVVCNGPLVVNGEVIGQLHLAQNITEDQLRLNSLIKGLSLVCLLIVGIMAVAIALYIRQSLQPLRKISQVAGTISAHDLSQAQLSLDDAPTEVRELANTLDAMLSRLSLSWEQQQQLLGNISHELRTPLTVTSGYLQCMQRRNANLSETQREMLDTALAETERTIQMLQSLLDLARADTGCMYLHPEKLILNELVADVVMIGAQSTQRQILLEADHEAIEITTDRDCLTQALMHLIENAAKYSPIDQSIVIKLGQSKQQIMIQVRDKGCGICLEQQQRVFEPFYRVDDARSRETGGVGLGLAIVKTLVERLEGQIHLWSQPEAGSLFTITLPVHIKPQFKPQPTSQSASPIEKR